MSLILGFKLKYYSNSKKDDSNVINWWLWEAKWRVEGLQFCRWPEREISVKSLYSWWEVIAFLAEKCLIFLSLYCLTRSWLCPFQSFCNLEWKGIQLEEKMLNFLLNMHLNTKGAISYRIWWLNYKIVVWYSIGLYCLMKKYRSFKEWYKTVINFLVTKAEASGGKYEQLELR